MNLFLKKHARKLWLIIGIVLSWPLFILSQATPLFFPLIGLYYLVTLIYFGTKPINSNNEVLTIFVKLKKYLLRFFCLILFWLWPLTMFEYQKLIMATDNSSDFLEHLVIKLLRMPYYELRDYNDRILLKDNLEDLEEITPEEWSNMKVRYEYDNLKEANAFDRDLSIDPTKFRKLTQKDKIEFRKEKNHLYDLLPKFMIRYHLDNDKRISEICRNEAKFLEVPTLCHSVFNCRSISISIHDYILKYPKVLNNLIKILEKPCFYLKELPTTTNSNIKDINYEEKEALRYMKDLRTNLHCDLSEHKHLLKKDRIFSEIQIYDKCKRRTRIILIPRKDNNKL
jgi:hypothetical protein